LNNIKQFTLASLQYCEQNDGKIVPGYQKCISKVSGGRGSGLKIQWNDVQTCLPSGGSWIGKPWGTFSSVEEGWKIAIEYGLLFNYVKNRATYICPIENIVKGKVWYSYAPSEGMNGWIMNCEDDFRKSVVGEGYRKIFDVRRPGSTLSFVDQGEFDNEAGWGQYSASRARRNMWLNPPMLRHSKGMTFSYMDGHAGLYIWKDSRTIATYKTFMASPNAQTYADGSSTDSNPNQDLRYVQLGQWQD
jgi:prepilin-type processing-associated H-X9-DG protein